MTRFTNIMGFLDDQALELLDQYYNSGHFSGARFDTYGGGGDRPDLRNRFTDADLTAVSLLGGELPGRAKLMLIDDDEQDLAELLSAIPADVSLTDVQAEGLVSRFSEAWRLWDRLARTDGLGPAAAHRLCARKRPHLLPVYDAVMEASLIPPHRAVWRTLWETLQQPEIVARLEELRFDLGRSDLSLLRILYVCIWMRSSSNHQTVD